MTFYLWGWVTFYDSAVKEIFSVDEVVKENASYVEEIVDALVHHGGHLPWVVVEAHLQNLKDLC